MATKPSATESDMLKDGRSVLETSRKHLAGFVAADKDKEIKTITSDWLLAFATDLSDLDHAMNGQKVQRVVMSSATSTEQRSRQPLYELLVKVRDDVKIAHPKDAVLLSAFGVGTVLSVSSTPLLVSAAGGVLELMNNKENKEHRTLAKQAGVTDAKLKTIEKLRDELTAADTTQGKAKGASKARTITKQQLLLDVKKKTSYARRAAKTAFRGDKAILAEFESTIPHHTPTPRAPKAAAKSAAPSAADVKAPPTDPKATR